ncbi:6-phosphogluconolactonase [Tomitella biformata]|uniref:6-phosphogluconolactonase n=1 Tax=Tomitella biformata TaxID=630403 RepID=UPI000466695D|nr:6-phosphogluconolactonase [Tomitella biformata]
MTHTELLRFPDQGALVADAAQRLTTAIAEAQDQRGIARIVLTGGGAGIALLAALRESAADIDWQHIEFYWGDERFLPPSDPERNEVQARKALLNHVPVDHMKVHPMPTDSGQFAGDVDAAAEFYRLHLPTAVDSEGVLSPLFDVHLLGMGGEGHVNSIFPDSPAVHEAEATVVPVRNCPKPPPTRITMTLPLVRRSAQVWLLVAGAEKAVAAAAAINGASPVDIPSAGALGVEQTLWFLDEAAAADL